MLSVLKYLAIFIAKWYYKNKKIKHHLYKPPSQVSDATRERYAFYRLYHNASILSRGRGDKYAFFHSEFIPRKST